MRIIVLTYFLLLVKYLTDNIAKQGAIFLSIFGIGSKLITFLSIVIINKKQLLNYTIIYSLSKTYSICY